MINLKSKSSHLQVKESIDLLQKDGLSMRLHRFMIEVTMSLIEANHLQKILSND